MDSIKWLFNKNTRHGRGLRTALQALLGVITFVAGILALPGLGDVLAQNNVTTLASFGVWVGFISYAQNFLEDLWKDVQ